MLTLYTSSTVVNILYFLPPFAVPVLLAEAVFAFALPPPAFAVVVLEEEDEVALGFLAAALACFFMNKAILA